MTLLTNIQMVELDKKILKGTGSYCLRSKKKSEGYLQKNKWLNNRFDEGLKYIQLFENNKQVGFIEYAVAEYSSRVVHADNYLVIHCLWVSEVGKGYGTKLINTCIEDAIGQSKLGVAVVTNTATSWAPSRDIFLRNNFILVDKAPNNFELLVYQFNDNKALPFFPTNWEERISKYDRLTILRSFQCPYVEVATENIMVAASKLGFEVEIIDLNSREDLMQLSPTPYGIYSVLFKKQLITFHRLTVHSVMKRLKELI